MANRTVRISEDGSAWVSPVTPLQRIPPTFGPTDVYAAAQRAPDRWRRLIEWNEDAREMAIALYGASSSVWDHDEWECVVQQALGEMDEAATTTTLTIFPG